MIPKNGISLQYLKAALQRRFWYAVIAFFVIFMAVLIYCVKAPKVYRSSTLVLVRPQEVPSDYVRPTVTSDARARLSTLTEQIMSRPRLEEIIVGYHLYLKVRAAGTMQDAVEIMRKHITVEVKGRRDTAAAAFEVSYEGQEPVAVRDVTAAIANLFIEDDLKLRERLAAGTSQFLDRQLERTRKELRRKEDLVRQFKEEYLGLLPEQMESNYRVLAQFQQHLDSLNATLQQTEDRKALLQTQMARIEALQADAFEARSSISSSANGQIPLSLEELRQELEAMKARYTDQHPMVIRLEATVDRLGKKQEATRPETDQQSLGVSSRPTEAQRLMLVQREDLLGHMKLIDRQVQKLNEEKRQTSEEIKKYHRRIENGPRIEQMFVDVRRDYEEATRNYQSLLEKKLQAELAENLERTRKGEQFRVLEPANLPQKPFKPNIRKVVLLGLMAALATGVGLAFLRDCLDPTFCSAKDLETHLDLSVIASIPAIVTPRMRRLGLYKRICAMSALICLCLTLLYTLFVLLRKNPTLLPFSIG